MPEVAADASPVDTCGQPQHLCLPTSSFGCFHRSKSRSRALEASYIGKMNPLRWLERHAVCNKSKTLVQNAALIGFVSRG